MVLNERQEVLSNGLLLRVAERFDRLQELFGGSETAC